VEAGFIFVVTIEAIIPGYHLFKKENYEKHNRIKNRNKPIHQHLT
jgi:hypothetical protein